jgi:DNA helicase-2/ATP-dependent DNA helicase PcrA
MYIWGMDFLNSLNESQREAVINFEGPCMVIAGAGSGKTRVLTYRIAYLIQHGVDPFSILALTFTNKAAREMKHRISSIVGEGEAQNIWMGTFHSIFARILRIESDRIGYPRNFSIYDSADSRNLIKNIIKEMNLDDKVYKPNLVHARISAAKNNLIGPKAYERNEEIISEDHQSKKPLLHKIYATYDKRLFQSGAMDFDDLLFKTNVLFRDHDDLLHKYQHKFNYVLVDEYQDTNCKEIISGTRELMCCRR